MNIKNPGKQKSEKPPISWNGNTKTFHIFLEGVKNILTQDKDSIEAEWSPEITYVIRIREIGKENGVLDSKRL